MADEADMADKRIEESIGDGINESSRFVAQIPAGEPGECDGCGETFARVVNGYCGRCRDRFARYVK